MAALPIGVLHAVTRPVRSHATSLASQLLGKQESWSIDHEARLRRRESVPFPGILLAEQLRLLEGNYKHFQSICTSLEASEVKPCSQTSLASFLDSHPSSASLASSSASSCQSVTDEQRGRFGDEFRDPVFLGRGGFGSVVRVRHQLDGCEYAVKIIVLPNQEGPAREQAFNEARSMAQLKPHPNVVRYFASWVEASSPTTRGGELRTSGHELSSTSLSSSSSLSACSSGEGDSFSWSALTVASLGSHEENSEREAERDGKKHGEEESLFIQMGLCKEGSTLAQWLKSRCFHPQLANGGAPQQASDERLLRGGSLKPEDVAIFQQVLSAVAHIHASGLQHLDLSPRNIFHSGENVWCVGDFSFARSLSARLDPRTPIGTYLYAAPELLLSSSSSSSPGDNAVVGERLIERQGVFEGQNSCVDSAVCSTGCPGAADVFSLGVILTELCFDFDTGMERAVVLETLRKTGRTPLGVVDSDLASLIESMVARDPSRRPTVSSVLDELVRISHKSPGKKMTDHDLSASTPRDIMGAAAATSSAGHVLNAEEVVTLQTDRNSGPPLSSTNCSPSQMASQLKIFRAQLLAHLSDAAEAGGESNGPLDPLVSELGRWKEMLSGITTHQSCNPAP